MIEIEIISDDLKLAHERASNLSNLRGSFTQGKSAIYGTMGEILVLKYLKGSQYTPTFDYDIIYHDKTIDVKSKRCRSQPRSDYNCSISTYNTKQNCDIYVFTRVSECFQKGWILGWMGKQNFFKKACFNKKGETDGDKGFTFQSDCYNLTISQLFSIEKL